MQLLGIGHLSVEAMLEKVWCHITHPLEKMIIYDDVQAILT